MANNKNSLYLSDELQEYLENQCTVYGIGKSAFISMVLTTYRQQNEALLQMSKMEDYIKRFEYIVKEGNKIDK